MTQLQLLKGRSSGEATDQGETLVKKEYENEITRRRS